MTDRTKQILRLTALAFLVLLLILSPFLAEWHREDRLEIHMLDVGQGDCMLLRTPEGDILIDAGTESSQELLLLRLQELKVEHLLLAVFTHSDEDHIGGADGVLSSIKVDRIWLNGSKEENDSVRHLNRALENSDTAVEIVCAEDEAHFGELCLTVLAPFSANAAEGNEGSIILRVSYGAVTMLCMGDAGTAEEQELISYYGRVYLDCDILKVGHHGSYTSSGLYFLSVTTPSYALISAAEGNSYGHPHGSVLRDLEETGARVLRTDQEGDICLVTDGETVEYKKNNTVFGGWS